ncbi:MAG: hypothetical protein ACYDC8_00565 [Gammaproteobacteria bacterium]
MRPAPDWAVQLSWSVSGIFATGAVWYFLSLNEYLNASLAAVGAAIFAVIAIILHRLKDKTASAKVDKSPAEEFARRYTDQPGHIRFIESLPKLKHVIYENAHEGWDTGTTVEMQQASYDVIDFLEYSWLRLSEFYPPGQFGKINARDYIRDYIRSRFEFHWSKYEPDGPGTRGTVVGVMVGGKVINDLETMIADTIGALFMDHDQFDYLRWVSEWRGNMGSGELFGSQ